MHEIKVIKTYQALGLLTSWPWPPPDAGVEAVPRRAVECEGVHQALAEGARWEPGGSLVHGIRSCTKLGRDVQVKFNRNH